MVNQELRAELPEDGIVFDNPAFDNSIIGYDVNGCVVYDYDKMVKEFMEDYNTSELDAIDFIEYNTLGTLPYISEHCPVIMFSFD